MNVLWKGLIHFYPKLLNSHIPNLSWYMTFLPYFGANTICYLHSHLVYAKLFLGYLLCFRAVGESAFIITLKVFTWSWSHLGTHLHSRWFIFIANTIQNAPVSGCILSSTVVQDTTHPTLDPTFLPLHKAKRPTVWNYAWYPSYPHQSPIQIMLCFLPRVIQTNYISQYSCSLATKKSLQSP